MKRTISLKKAREILDSRTIDDLSEEERQKIMQAYQSAPLPKSKPVVWQRYVLDGKAMIHTYCHACNKHGITDFPRECPHCGNKQSIPFSNQVDAKKCFVYILEVNEDEGYFVFMITPEYIEFQSSGQKNQDESLSFQYMETPAEHSVFLNPDPYERYILMGMFLKNKGFLFKNCPSQDSTRHAARRREFMCSTVLNEYLLRSFTKGMELKEFCDKFETKQTSKEADDQSVSELATLPLPNHIFTDFPEKDKFALCKIKTDVGDYVERYHYCSVCKKITLEKGNRNSDREWICPECKEQFYSSGNKEYYKTQAIAEIVPNSSNLILRNYLIKYNLDANGTLTNDCEETCRVLISPKKIVAVALIERKKIKISEFSPVLKPMCTVQTPQQLQEIIADSVLSRSGLIEWMKINGSKTRTDIIAYANAWQKIPQIEMLAKCGMKSAVAGIINAPTTWLKKHGRSKATNPIDFLGISRFVFREAREHDMGLEHIKSLQELWKTDNSVNFDIYQKLFNMYILDKVIDVRNKYDVTYKRMLEYLENVETYQCCPQKEAFDIWYDYLDLASKINYDLTQRSVKFPNSLKKAHDIASYAYDAIAEEHHEKEFADRAMENDHYAFSDGDYIVKIPHSQQELIRESQVLSHCVKVYIDRVREGKTIIAFLRNADEPDTPLYTMEIRNGAIAQLRGYCNRTLNDTKMLSFVKKFAEEKHLKQNFSY